MKPSASGQSQCLDAESIESMAASEPVTPRADALGPVRLSAGGGSGFERLLVGASALDRMPAEAHERLARALGVPAAAAPPTPLGLPSSAAGPAPPERMLATSSWFKIGAFVGLSAIGWLAATATNRWLEPAPVEPTTSARVLIEASALAATDSPVAPSKPEPETAPALSLADVPITGVPTPAAPTPALVTSPSSASLARSASASPRARSAPAEAARRPASRAAAPPRPIASSADRASARAELQALESCQAALREGRIEAAEKALADYARRFPRGELAIEAELLEVDVLVARGLGDRARERARALLGRAGAARYRERLEAIGIVASELDSMPSSAANPPPTHMNGQR